jgi:hypothetical protein
MDDNFSRPLSSHRFGLIVWDCVWPDSFADPETAPVTLGIDLWLEDLIQKTLRSQYNHGCDRLSGKFDCRVALLHYCFGATSESKWQPIGDVDALDSILIVHHYQLYEQTRNGLRVVVSRPYQGCWATVHHPRTGKQLTIPIMQTSPGTATTKSFKESFASDLCYLLNLVVDKEKSSFINPEQFYVGFGN